MYLEAHVCVYVHVHANGHTHMCVCVYVHVHANGRLHVHMHVHVHAHVHAQRMRRDLRPRASVDSEDCTCAYSFDTYRRSGRLRSGGQACLWLLVQPPKLSTARVRQHSVEAQHSCLCAIGKIRAYQRRRALVGPEMVKQTAR